MEEWPVDQPVEPLAVACAPSFPPSFGISSSFNEHKQGRTKKEY
jgi:hypothetical protein